MVPEKDADDLFVSSFLFGSDFLGKFWGHFDLKLGFLMGLYKEIRIRPKVPQESGLRIGHGARKECRRPVCIQFPIWKRLSG
jgi:hypothetical protein